MKIQDERLAQLKDAETEKCRILEDINKSKKDLEAAIDKKMKMGPHSKDDWLDLAKAIVKPGLEYAKKRFIDVNIQVTGRGHMK